jgi:hypothetical protein
MKQGTSYAIKTVPTLHIPCPLHDPGPLFEYTLCILSGKLLWFFILNSNPDGDVNLRRHAVRGRIYDFQATNGKEGGFSTCSGHSLRLRLLA